MKLTPEQIALIKIDFNKMRSLSDFYSLLNKVKPFVYGEKSIPFETKQINFNANPKSLEKSPRLIQVKFSHDKDNPEVKHIRRSRYSKITIKKKSGEPRFINAPNKGLKSIQKVLNVILQCVFEPHQAATGFVRNKSVVDNAKKHVGNRYVYNIDLKDFFSSIDQARVWKCFQLKPFNLNNLDTSMPKFLKWTDFKNEYLLTDESISLYQGKGRKFTLNLDVKKGKSNTGTLGAIKIEKSFNRETIKIYVSDNCDLSKEKYVIVADDKLTSRNGKQLKGTLWLVNEIPSSHRLDIANIIASLCCTELEVNRKNENGEWIKVNRNVLPQGAPTSPIISNIVCQRLDQLLTGAANRFGVYFTRYADDITFSSMHNVYQQESEFIRELHRIIIDQGFYINNNKTRLQKDGYRKEVTGLLVNEKVNVQKRYIKQLRMWLYYWERYGYEKAFKFFLEQYKLDKGHVKKGKPDMESIISGKLDYLKMVKGADNELYLKLRNRFNAVSGRIDPIEVLLDTWKEKGIEASMRNYYKVITKDGKE